MNRARPWLQAALLLVLYTAVSSFLGLILLLPWLGPLGLLAVWSTSIAADIVFVIGSIAGAAAGAGAGHAVGRTARNYMTLSAGRIGPTYCIAAELAAW